VTKKQSIVSLLLVLLIAACVKKAKSHRESEWHGLTETEARSKLDARLPGRIPDHKRSAISEKVVAKMRDRGVISKDPDVTDELAETSETV
jgi:hypothetical protein